MQSNNENSLNDQISSSNYRLRQQPWQHLHRLEEHLRSEDQCWGPFRILRGRGEQPSVFQGSQWDHRELQQAGHGRQRRLVRTEWTVQLRKKLLAFIEDFLLIYVSWKIDCVPDSRVGISPATVAAVASVLNRLSAVKTPTILGWGAGRITLSMTWMTPLAAATSAWTTFELPIVTPAIKEKCWTFNENSDSKIYRKYSFELLPLETTALATSPLTKGTSPVWRSVLRTFPDTTWPRRTAFSFSGFAMRPSRAPAGRARKAASVGANRVNGPAKKKIVSLHWRFFTHLRVVENRLCTWFKGRDQSSNSSGRSERAEPLISGQNSNNIGLRRRQNHFIDDMDDTISGSNVSLNDIRASDSDTRYKGKNVEQWKSNSKICRKYSFELLPLETTALAASPLTKGTSPVWRSVLRTFPDTTWPRRTAFNFSGFAIRPSRAPAGRARKAASVGANRVNGPAVEDHQKHKNLPSSLLFETVCILDCRVGISPAAVAAVASVLNRLSAVRTPTISGWGAGRITLSMTWMTPLLVAISAWVTLELPTVTPPLSRRNR